MTTPSITTSSDPVLAGAVAELNDPIAAAGLTDDLAAVQQRFDAAMSSSDPNALTAYCYPSLAIPDPPAPAPPTPLAIDTNRVTADDIRKLAAKHPDDPRWQLAQVGSAPPVAPPTIPDCCRNAGPGVAVCDGSKPAGWNAPPVADPDGVGEVSDAPAAFDPITYAYDEPDEQLTVAERLAIAREQIDLACVDLRVDGSPSSVATLDGVSAELDDLIDHLHYAHELVDQRQPHQQAQAAFDPVANAGLRMERTDRQQQFETNLDGINAMAKAKADRLRFTTTPYNPQTCIGFCALSKSLASGGHAPHCPTIAGHPVADDAEYQRLDARSDYERQFTDPDLAAMRTTVGGV